MYVSERRKWLFVHIPKTGGTAIKRIVGNFKRIGEKHGKLSDLEEPEQYRDYFLFAVVRNPYQRYVSEYRFRKMWHEKSPEVLRDKGVEFDWHFRSFSSYLKYCIQKQGLRVQADFVRHNLLAPAIYKYEETDFSIFGQNIRGADTNFHGHYDWREWVDSEGVEIINQHCAEDFERFGYEMWTDLSNTMMP